MACCNNNECAVCNPGKYEDTPSKKMAVHYSSKTDDWATPQVLFDELNKKYGPFSLDPASSVENAKCHFYFTKEDDGLAHAWHALPIRLKEIKVFLNPPYGREIGKWVKKAYEESRKGCLVVALLPARTDTRWFHDYIYGRPGVQVDFLRGRVKFGNAVTGAPFPSMVVVFRPKEDK